MEYTQKNTVLYYGENTPRFSHIGQNEQTWWIFSAKNWAQNYVQQIWIDFNSLFFKIIKKMKKNQKAG